MTILKTRNLLPLLRLLRKHFADDHIGVVLRLLRVAPHAGRHTQRLPASAYRKGLIAGLSYDSLDKAEPQCPYGHRALSNFAKGDNDPRDAWRNGWDDARRISDIVLRPERPIHPSLMWREFEVLSPELQQAHREALAKREG